MILKITISPLNASVTDDQIQLTLRFSEDCAAHKFLETICIETRPVHRYSVLQIQALNKEEKKINTQTAFVKLALQCNV